MALKRKLTAEEYNALSADLKKEYAENPSRKGEYLVSLDGDDESITALKAAKDAAAKEARDATKKAKEAEDALAAIEDERRRKSGDIPALEASWKEKVDAAKREGQTAVDKLKSQLGGVLVSERARSMATKLSTSPELLLPHITSRLSVDLDGDEPKTRVLDATGKPTAATLEDLEKEVLADKRFAAIIIASKASGGRATRESQTSRARPAVNDDGKPVNLASLGPVQLKEAVKARIAGRESEAQP